MKKSRIAVLIILVVLLVDQIVKIWIKTTMYPGEEINVFGEWFKIHFLENYGMAFGFSFGGEFGKLALSIFRIIAIGLLGYYIYWLSKKDAKLGVIISISLIFAGAAGNIIDSAFYGLIFGEYLHYGQISEIFPEAGGYASFLHGKVVDMFYFPVLDFWFPDDFPIWPGKHFIFFRPVFNLADSSITVGVASILLFHRDFLSHEFLSSKHSVKLESHE